MKLRIASDLHLQSSPGTPAEWEKRLPRMPNEEEQVLILAGDIHTGTRACEEFLPEMTGRFAHVVYVLGNHEFFGADLYSLQAKIDNEMAAYLNFSLMEDDVLDFGDVHLMACTLWTDLSDPHTAHIIEGSMNEYFRAKVCGRPLRSEDTHLAHELSVDFLKGELAKPAVKRIVVTHHLPSYKSVHPQYRSGPSAAINRGFYSNLDGLVGKADLWVHGHTHMSMDYKIGDCTVICNPYGYPGERGTGYNPKLVIDV